MQSIFRLPWCSDQFGSSKPGDKAALEKMSSAPLVEIPMFNRLKRKHSGNFDPLSPQSPPLAKKTRPEAGMAEHGFPMSAFPGQSASSQSGDIVQRHVMANGPLTPITTPTTNAPSSEFCRFTDVKTPLSRASDSVLVPTLPALSTDVSTAPMPDIHTDTASRYTRLQQTVENEFNLQILMKHNELRLIEQELAKCHIALEQLRRCELQPYPGGDQPLQQSSDNVVVAPTPPAGFTQPPNPAPQGVTDGPYSHHYRQWLLHDTQFDSVSMQELVHADAHSDARSTRYNGQARKSVGKSVAHASRRSESMNSIPNYPSAPPKDKSAPLVLRRSTDNQLVKLICNNCLRGNFSSIQGFLNHCRIAHKVDYKSHDLAAIDCGRVLDENELAGLPTESQAPSVPKPQVSRASTAHSTPIRSNLVHPLNTNVGGSVSGPQTASRPHVVPARHLSARPVPSGSATPLKASSQVPRLSQLFAKHNFGGDLEQAATAARQKIDVGQEDLWSPDVSQDNSPVALFPGARTITSVRPSMLNTSDDLARPASRKGYRQPVTQRPRPTSLMPAHGIDVVQSPDESPSTTFSPHAADSNPGLVSDHEDDDHGSASEEEAPHAAIPHPLPVPRHCADNIHVEVEEDDEIDQHRVIIRRNSLFAPEARGMCSTGSPSKDR